MGALVEIFRLLATALNLVMFLSPVPAMREIVRNKTTGHMPFVPLAAMGTNAHVWMVYGWLSKDYVALFGSCAFGVAVALVYCFIYYRFTTEKAYAHKVLAWSALAIFINSFYPIVGVHGWTNQSDDGVKNVVGYICIASSVMTYSSPLEKISQVLQHRSAVFIPIHMVVVGTVKSAAWVVYTLLDIDWLVFGLNVVLLAIGLVQIALYMAFHPATHPFPIVEVRADKTELPGTHDRSRVSSWVPVSPVPLDDGAGFVALRSPHTPLQQV